MQNINKRNLLFIGIGIILVGYIAMLLLREKPGDAASSTSFYSPLVDASDSLTINYGGSADANIDAVITNYKIFALDSLPMTDNAKKAAEEILPSYIGDYIQPSFKTTYIHIVRSTIEQTGPNSYSFDFYVDNPEAYFHYASDSTSGLNPVTQIPWEGIQ